MRGDKKFAARFFAASISDLKKCESERFFYHERDSCFVTIRRRDFALVQAPVRAENALLLRHENAGVRRSSFGFQKSGFFPTLNGRVAHSAKRATSIVVKPFMSAIFIYTAAKFYHISERERKDFLLAQFIIHKSHESHKLNFRNKTFCVIFSHSNCYLLF
jgi:hypothetical protein